MKFPILIEPVGDGRFRARAGEPFGLSAEAETAQAAALALEKHLNDRLAAGAQIAVVNLKNGTPAETLAPLPADDLYQTDWAFRELQEEIAANRQIEESAGS